MKPSEVYNAVSGFARNQRNPQPSEMGGGIRIETPSVEGSGLAGEPFRHTTPINLSAMIGQSPGSPGGVSASGSLAIFTSYITNQDGPSEDASGDSLWIDMSNVVGVPDGLFTYTDLTGDGAQIASNRLICPLQHDTPTFAFTAGDLIKGLVVTVYISAYQFGSLALSDQTLRLRAADAALTFLGTEKTYALNTLAEHRTINPITLGSPTNLWGMSAAAMKTWLNTAGANLLVQVTPGVERCFTEIDAIRLQVTYLPG